MPIPDREWAPNTNVVFSVSGRNGLVRLAFEEDGELIQAYTFHANVAREVARMLDSGCDDSFNSIRFGC
jgi:hypothetical protein